MPNNTSETSNGNGKRKILIKPEISIGNILTIGSFIVLFSIAWGSMETQIVSLSKKLDAVEAAGVLHATDVRVHYMIGSPAEYRLDEIKVLVTRIDEKISAHMKDR